jgi:hypothetical protein
MRLYSPIPGTAAASVTSATRARVHVRTHGFTGVAATVGSLKRAMKFSVAGVLYELWCRASNGPDLSRDPLIRHVSSISVEVW